MKSLVLTRDGLQFADTPIPPVLPGEVRIEVRAVGICRTDLAILDGDYDVKLPLVLGHELSGFVHESSVPGFESRLPVTTEIDRFCGRCWYCNTNRRHLCANRLTIGIDTDGGLSEYLSVPAELVHVLPDGVGAVEGTFVEPLASAIATVRKTMPEKGEQVVVIGSGKLGLLLAQVYDAYGAEVYLVGRNRYQLGLALQVGLRNTIDMSSTDWKARVLSVTNKVGPGIVVEATGTPAGYHMATEIVRNGGALHLKSMHGKKVEFDPTDVVNKELEIYGTSRGPYKIALDMLAKQRIEVRRLVSKEFKFEDAPRAFEYASQSNVSKVIINI